jgi:ubiquinone/menaquinone biosynthesis C-methylase UbiE
MIERAKAKLPEGLSGRVEFLVGDAERLPFTDGSLDLVVQISVPVFFDEVTRVLAPGGYVVVVSSLGLKTPSTRPSARCATAFGGAGWRSSPPAPPARARFSSGRLSSPALPK